MINTPCCLSHLVSAEGRACKSTVRLSRAISTYIAQRILIPVIFSVRIKKQQRRPVRITRRIQRRDEAFTVSWAAFEQQLTSLHYFTPADLIRRRCFSASSFAVELFISTVGTIGLAHRRPPTARLRRGRFGVLRRYPSTTCDISADELFRRELRRLAAAGVNSQQQQLPSRVRAFLLSRVSLSVLFVFFSPVLRETRKIQKCAKKFISVS